MSSRYVIREFIQDGIYHVYNRGVEKREVFLDEKDYNIFLYYLSVYTLPSSTLDTKYPSLPIRLHAKNLHNKIEIYNFCLMPNHIHLLIHQKTPDAIPKLMQQLTNAYTFYFNQRYKRVGGLFQGRYKAVRIQSDEQLVQVSRYIDLNPVSADIVSRPELYKWSNFKNLDTPKLCTTKYIFDYFPDLNKYKEFVKDNIDYKNSTKEIENLTLEDTLF